MAVEYPNFPLLGAGVGVGGSWAVSHPSRVRNDPQSPELLFGTEEMKVAGGRIGKPVSHQLCTVLGRPREPGRVGTAFHVHPPNPVGFPYAIVSSQRCLPVFSVSVNP